MLDNRKNSFEFFGYDFMVDENLKVWLLEVNSSPCLEGIEGATNKDIAGEMIRAIEKNFKL